MNAGEFDPVILDGAFDTLSLVIGALGASILLRTGLVFTTIIAQYITIALTYAYISQYSVALAILLSIIASIIVITMSYCVRIYNKRSYIIVLYALSLASIPAGNLVMRVLGKPDESGYGSASPSVPWSLSDWATTFFAIAVILMGFAALTHLHRSWRGVFLQHWSSLPARSISNMRHTGTFNFKALARAIWPAAVASALLFVAAVMIGCFAQERAYTSGSYDTLPFFALLFALAARNRHFLLIVMTIAYVCFRAVFDFSVQQRGLTLPIQSTYILYGALFFLFGWIAAKKEP